jgi:hypothetical protein
MLPFLKRQQEASVALPVESVKRDPDEDAPEADSLTTAMEELHDALNRKDYSGAADIFRSAMDLSHSDPTEES